MDLSKIKWVAKQLIPSTYWTVYGVGINEDGTARDEWRFVIWRMWLGRCYNTLEFPIESSVSASGHFANRWPGDPRSDL